MATHRLNRWLAIPILAGAAAPAALADHIPGHSNGDPVFPIPIPGQEFFSGGAVFVNAIGPVGGTEIVGTTFDITFVSDGVEAASDLHIALNYLTPDFNLVEFEVTGADLGFTSGPGTFHGTFSTGALNGVIAESFLLPPNSQINLTIASADGFIDGLAYFENSFINLDVIPAPGAVGTLGLAGFAAACRRRR